MAAIVTFADEYVRAESIDDALEALRGGGAQLVAGGTDVILHPDPSITRLVDLGGLGLDFVTEEDLGIRIGAMTTLTEILQHPSIQPLAGGVVATMMRQVGSPLLRNIATIGGHLARGKLSDVVPVLLALDARVTIRDGTRRELLLDDFYDSGMPGGAYLIESIFLPRPQPGTTGAFIKFGRTGFDLAMLNAACAVTPQDGVVGDVRVVVGETPWLAARVPEAEDALEDQPLDATTIATAATAAQLAVRVGSDLRASARYRRQLVCVAVARCLQDIAHRNGDDT